MADALEMAGRSDWDLRQLPGVNHQLAAVDDMDTAFQLEQADDFDQERHPVAPAVLDTLTEWLNRLATTPTPRETGQ